MNTQKQLEVDSILKLSPEEGLITLFDERMLLMHGFSLAGLRRDLIEQMGHDAARRIFTRMGYQQGIKDYEILSKHFGNNFGELLDKGVELRNLQGYLHNSPYGFEFSRENEAFLGHLTWENSWEADAHLEHFGHSGTPACWMNIGYGTALSTHTLGKPVLLREVECVAMGHSKCRCVIKPLPEWDNDEISKDIGFLQLEDFIDPPLQGGKKRFNKSLILPLPENPEKSESELIGSSPAFNSAAYLLKRVATTDASVLFLGETGVGKERFSKTLHQLSDRRDDAFVAVNCAAIPENLIESELFGVEAGAFTGANKSRAGKFERANKGTLFLDEIGTLPLAAQGKLLRAIQEQEIERVGGTQVKHINVRLVAATNEDLRLAVDQGRFRADLFYRLNVFPIEIPTLRDRKEDIPLMLSVFVERYASRYQKNIRGVSRAALDALTKYEWPGNVRELENMVERAVILADDNNHLDLYHFFSGGERFDISKLTPVKHFHEASQPHDTERDNTKAAIDTLLDQGLTLAEIEKDILNIAIDRHNGKLAPTAKTLGLGKGQIHYKIKKLRDSD
jgi:DNA-binding NtrC family response regulator